MVLAIIYLFIFSERRGREKERERNISCMTPSPQTRDLAPCPESNRDTLLCRTTPNSHTGQGCPGNDFLDMTPEAQTIKAKINKWDYIKPKSFCTSKETVKKIKRQPL